MGKFIDLKDQVFGKLTVLEKAGSDKNRNTIWKCECSCGNEVIVRGDKLKNGTTKSCGCYRKEWCASNGKASKKKDLTNQRFGFLVVLYPTDKKTSDRHVIWHCKCNNCGAECDISSQSLLRGNTSSCGCVKSKGEMKLSQLLRERNITFKAQYTDDRFIRQSTGYNFRFDFCLLDDENQPLAFIEYNGSQHYQFSGSGWDTKENFLETVTRDQEKEELCKQLNIPLYVIRYDQDIEEELNKILTYENFM